MDWTFAAIVIIVAGLIIGAILVATPGSAPLAKAQPARNRIAEAAQAIATAEYERLMLGDQDVARAIATAEGIVRGEEKGK